ncbi:MAG: hypothetical protein VB041_07555, partial [Candidatus Limiplasma sp.]|nr:hypothetical protein [Candidatus Limiplasma sp.]
FIEMCYSLRKINYQGWVSVDIFPFREPAFRAAEESIRNLMNFDKVVDKIGVDNIEKAINGTDATEGLRLIREAMFGK